MSDTAYKIKVMQAFVDGKPVQVSSGEGGLVPPGKTQGQWDSYKEGIKPRWDWQHFEYRIKPEPLELWVNVPTLVDDLHWFSTRQGAQNACGALSKPTLFRQVLDSDAE